MRAVAVGTGAFAHLAHVDANAHARQIALRGVRLLQAESKRDRRARRLKRQKTTVSSPAHDPAIHLCSNLSHLFPVPTYQLFHCLIATLPLQRRRICEVGKDERENPGDPRGLTHGRCLSRLASPRASLRMSERTAAASATSTSR